MKALLRTVLIAAGITVLAACSTGTSNEKGEPAMPSFEQLSGEPWQVQTLNGESIENATVTLVFPEQGRVAGRAACNNYMGSYRAEGEQFSIQPGGMTMKACPQPLMTLERQFVDALKGINHAVINEEGTLLLTGEGIAIQASR